MDHFERQLALMMRSTEEHTPYEVRQQDRLREGVRVRRRLRAARNAAGSVLAVAAIGLVLLLRPEGTEHVEPSSPRPEPATSPTSSEPGPSPTLTSTHSPSMPPSTADGGASATTSPPPATESATTGATSPPPTGTTETASPPVSTTTEPASPPVSSTP